MTGWKPQLSLKDPEDGSYALKLGPVRLSDSSGVIRGECARPERDLILYEYEASPFCRKVREAMGILDLTVEMRPCPGARYSDFSDELEAKTGRRTVPYLIDPNTGTVSVTLSCCRDDVLSMHGVHATEGGKGRVARCAGMWYQ